MALKPLARLVIDPDYPRPLSQRDLDWLADLLSVFASEYLKGEHRNGGTLWIHEPPSTYKRSLAYVDEQVP